MAGGAEPTNDVVIHGHNKRYQARQREHLPDDHIVDNMATQLDIAALQRQIKDMAMGIEKYTGHSASVPINDWLEDFKLLAVDQGRQTNEEKAHFLAFHLAMDTKVFYHGLSQQKADYDTLKQKLQAKFLPTASDIQAAKLAFYTRKQGPYESLRDFVHQAEIAARQLGLTPADQVNAVISNCRPAIRRLLRAQTFASLKELSKSPLTQEDFEEELHHPTLQAIMDKLDTFQQTQERPQTVKFAVTATDVPQQRDYRQSRHHNRE